MRVWVQRVACGQREAGRGRMRRWDRKQTQCRRRRSLTCLSSDPDGCTRRSGTPWLPSSGSAMRSHPPSSLWPPFRLYRPSDLHPSLLFLPSLHSHDSLRYLSSTLHHHTIPASTATPSSAHRCLLHFLHSPHSHSHSHSHSSHRYLQTPYCSPPHPHTPHHPHRARAAARPASASGRAGPGRRTCSRSGRRT
jgi:hypothetical protein